jgi:hypothetical protein
MLSREGERKERPERAKEYERTCVFACVCVCVCGRRSERENASQSER